MGLKDKSRNKKKQPNVKNHPPDVVE